MRRQAVFITISALVLLLIGAGGMHLMVRMRAAPPRQDRLNPGKLVRVLTIQPREAPLTIEAFGTVRAKVEWDVVPEVSGTAVQVSPYLRAGLHIKKGELLLAVDPRPYQLAVQRIRAEITQDRREIALLRQQQRNEEATLDIAQRNLTLAKTDLQRDEALVRKGTISTRERDRHRQVRNEVEQTVQTARNNQALIGPRIAKTEAAIAVSQARLDHAEFQLTKTRLVAPFDAQVIKTHLDVGEFVQTGQEVAKLYDMTVVEIPITISLDALRWFPTLSPEQLRDVSHPDTPMARTQTSALVRWGHDDVEYTWHGQLTRWEAGLDARTRTMTLVVEVRDPWKQFRPGQHPPLQPGMFCQVEIMAQRVPNAALIPRTALYEQDTVYLVVAGVLDKWTVRVLHLQRERAMITDGLQPGDQLIVSPLTAPIMGMKLRTHEMASAVSVTTSTPNPLSPAAVVQSGADQGAF